MKQVILGQDNRVGEWVMDQLGGGWVPGRGAGIGLERDGRLIAGAVFDSCNGSSLCMHVAAEPGRNWLNRTFLWTCFAYPFLQLKVKKVIGTVGSGNVDALAFDKSLGFVHEATLVDAHPDGDLIILTMTKDQCRWLNLKVNFNEQAKSSESS